MYHVGTLVHARHDKVLYETGLKNKAINKNKIKVSEVNESYKTLKKGSYVADGVNSSTYHIVKFQTNKVPTFSFSPTTKYYT